MKTPTLKTLRLIQFSLLVTCGIAMGAHAQGLVTDQSLQAPPYVAHESYHYDASLASLGPETGQEFTPSLGGLDFVEVSLNNSIASNTGTFEIAIHQSNIAGPVLSVSDQVVIPQSNPHFEFSSRVPLVAGDLYVLEVIQLAGDSGWTIEVPSYAVVNRQTIDMNYPGGRLIYGGVPQNNQDMLFREGIVMPEPSEAALLLLGALIFGFWSRVTIDRSYEKAV
jgi:hypothetical protein